MNMKKVSLLGFILAATAANFTPASAEGEAVAVAQPGPGCPKAFQGFHLGGNIGYGVGFTNHKYSSTDAPTKMKYDRAVKGVDGGIGVGYTHRFCNWALGVEFDANWTGVKGKDSSSFADNSATFKGRLRNSLQLLARFGYVMRDIAMPFIGLGWDNSQWRLGYNTSLDLSPYDINEIASNNKSKSKRLNAFLWRVGVDFLATKHVVVGFEYTGTIAGKQKFKHIQELGPVGEALAKNSAKPQYNKFALTAKIVY